MNHPARLGVLISGGGSNLQAIIDACAGGVLAGVATIAVVIANRADAYGLERARAAGVPAICLEPRAFGSRREHSAALLETLRQHTVDIVCLAGYLLKVEPDVLAAFSGRMLNIHPALLPKYGGAGMYGHHVHEAVIAAGDTESGATVHVVDGEYDHGPVILQETVPVMPGDTADALARRVLSVEHTLFPAGILKLIEQARRQPKPGALG